MGNDAWSGAKLYHNCSHRISSYFTRAGNIYTGLTDEDKTRLGEAIGIDLFNDKAYWDNFGIRLSADDVILNLEDPLDELKYLFLKSHKRVKNGINSKINPKATYVLIDVEGEAKEITMAHKAKREAFKHFDKLSATEMRKCLRLFGMKSDSISGELVERRMVEIIETNPQGFMDKWVNNVNKDIEFLIKESISKNIIRKNNNIYQYGSDVIGRSIDEAIGFFKNKENNDVKMAIMNTLKSKN